jgi:DNA gyrase subunit A
LTAHDNIDEVIHIIRDSKTDEESASRLNARFGFTPDQTDAILSMTLRKLQGLEQDKLKAEHAELVKNITEYNRLLSSKDNIVELMVQELTDIKARFGDPRLTDISDEAANIDNEALIPEQDIIVVLTNNGYLKRMSDATFRTQNRGGRGVKGISTTQGDTVNIMLHTKTHTDLMFFTSLGQVYKMRGYKIPDGARDSKGMPAINLLNMEQAEKVISIVPCDDYPESDYLFFATIGGVVKRTKLSEFARINSNGKRALHLRDGDQLLDVKRTNGTAIISLASSNGKVCSFQEEDVRAMGRDAAGVTGMNLKDGSHLVDITSSMEGDKILVLTTLGYGKISYAKDTATEDGRHYDGYRLTSRGAKGVISLKASDKNGQLTAMRAVHGDEDLMVITSHGIVIRTPLEQVKIAGRNTQGVKIIALDPHQTVASLAIVPHEDPNAPIEEAPVEEDVNPALVNPEEEKDDKPAAKPVTPDEVDEDASSSDGVSGSGKDDDI